MLTAICFGTNNLPAAGQFYDQVLSCINLHRCFENDVEIGYGLEHQPPCFWIVKPFNQEPASFGNGTQSIFVANSIDQVNSFYQTGIDLGGLNEGKPGPRDYSLGYYGAYLRDLDGNKLHVFCLSDSIESR